MKSRIAWIYESADFARSHPTDSFALGGGGHQALSAAIASHRYRPVASCRDLWHRAYLSHRSGLRAGRVWEVNRGRTVAPANGDPNGVGDARPRRRKATALLQ